MDIDRVNMIGVVLNFTVNSFKFRDVLIQKCQVMHITQTLGDTGRATHDFQKHLRNFTITPETVIDQGEVLADLTLNIHTQSKTVLFGQQKGLHDCFRTVFKDLFTSRLQLTTIAEKILAEAASAEITEQARGRIFFFIRLKNQGSRQVLCSGCVRVIILHELFNRQSFFAVFVSKESSDLFLLVKLELVGFTLQLKMQLIANSPEIIVR